MAASKASRTQSLTLSNSTLEAQMSANGSELMKLLLDLLDSCDNVV